MSPTPDQTTPETIRRAAALMRQRADAATPGPWAPGGPHIHPWELVVDHQLPLVEFTSDEHGRANAAHVASWHPAVALAVADWLEVAARDHRPIPTVTTPSFQKCVTCGKDPCPTLAGAAAVARAYLGEVPGV